MATKQACVAYVQTQLAYINTNNEDFIGFARCVLRTRNAAMKTLVTARLRVDINCHGLDYQEAFNEIVVCLF